MTQTEISRDQISLTVNGELRYFTRGTTVSELLASFALNPHLVVVERNRTILRDKTAFAAIQLQDGDSIELVHFVGGG